jgi:alpha-1,3-glucosyltransferase
MIPLIFYSRLISKYFFILNTIASYSIFPLLKEEAETPTKILFLLIYTFYVFDALSNYHSNLKKSFKLLNLIETSYLIGLIFVQLYTSLTTTVFRDSHNRLPFLYLLLTSVYCSIGILITWLRFYYQLIFNCY